MFISIIYLISFPRSSEISIVCSIYFDIHIIIVIYIFMEKMYVVAAAFTIEPFSAINVILID